MFCLAPDEEKKCRDKTTTLILLLNVVRLPRLESVLTAHDILAVTQQMSEREMTRYNEKTNTFFTLTDSWLASVFSQASAVLTVIVKCSDIALEHQRA